MILELDGGFSWGKDTSFSLGTVRMEAKPEILFKKIDDKEVARLKSTVTVSPDPAEFFKG
jgi:hypothetical protein